MRPLLRGFNGCQQKKQQQKQKQKPASKQGSNSGSSGTTTPVVIFDNQVLRFSNMAGRRFAEKRRRNN
jgi:hypothetical protein